MRVIFMGTPDFSVPVLRALAQHHDIVAVYSQPPRPAGRGKKERPSAVQTCAEGLGLPIYTPVSLRTEYAAKIFADHQAEIAVVVAYGLILPQNILDTPRHGCLNIHASLLPRWRGAAPIHRAIMAGDRETGVCIMQMEAGLDTGPVLLRTETIISDADTTADLHDRLSAMGADAIVAALDALPDLSPVAQPTDGVTYAVKIDKAESRVDWSLPAVTVDRMIRGLSPFPGAWCDVGGERIKLLRSRVSVGDGAPGRVLGGFTIACGTGAVDILHAQREGKRPASTTDILRGFTLPPLLT
jgi:methionyl-tRNA formyltransferase